MLGKNTLKFIKSLQQKKFRKQENAFFVEGAKNVTELLQSDFECIYLLYTPRFKSEYPDLVRSCGGQKYETTEAVLVATGSFSSNDYALAVARIKPDAPLQVEKGELALALDEVRDPGNLGTIIRIADWYGIRKLYLSQQCADFYNPKVLNASMGSFSRVSFQYVSLEPVLSAIELPVYGAFLEGKSIHSLDIEPEGIILVGNESKGISPGLEPFVSQKVTIPSFGRAESLNVAIATAVLCDNFRRMGGLS
ncbi:TrmH family RNA methyltransferase [Negadavirga shengliensis]|uniref:TrmH family RNA methyltransferase n=1 Tax=Negadavirga shengliensis TaxID=1389218 RepID=A0ABV9T835_9BACT